MTISQNPREHLYHTKNQQRLYSLTQVKYDIAFQTTARVQYGLILIYDSDVMYNRSLSTECDLWQNTPLHYFLCLHGYDILSRVWRFIVDQVQTNYHTVRPVLYSAYIDGHNCNHCGRMCFKSAKHSGFYNLSCEKF